MIANTKPSALEIISNMVSIVLQPLLMPTLAYAIILFGFPTLFANYNFIVKINLLLFVCLVTMIVPVLAILLLKQFGVISTLMMKERKERFIPMFFTSIIYLSFAYLLVTKFHINPLFSSIMVSIAFVTFATAFVTYFWQISVHSASISGLLSLMILLNIHINNELMFAFMMLLIIAVGVVMSARLYLNAHSIWQVIAGFVLGFGLNLFVILRLFGEI